MYIKSKNNQSSGKHVHEMYTPANPTFIIEKKKLGFAGVYLFFLFLLENIDVGTRKNHLGDAVLTCTHNQCFELTFQKYQNFSDEIFNAEKNLLFIVWACFHNGTGTGVPKSHPINPGRKRPY